MDSQPLRVQVALAALFTALLATPALAQRDDPGLQMHCAGDYFKFCAGADPDSPEVERCFARNRPRLSPACKAAIGAYDRGESTTTVRPNAPQ
ncbi:MAG: hypothetical protein PGN34_04540 [Methylobacterium frigidaeris]